MSTLQALFLAALQGFSELFPISSLGHSVVVPALLGWSNLDEHGLTFLPFLVALHLGTAAALLVFFWQDWLSIIGALLQSIVRGRFSGSPDEHLGWMLVVGTIPAGILGLFLQKPLTQLFGSPLVAATFLMVNGGLLLGGEIVRRRAEGSGGGVFFKHESGKELSALTWRSAVAIGAAQSLALIPGISRSGSTMVAGLVAGFKHESAARFSFLLATPIIAAAGLLEVPVLFGAAGRSMLLIAVEGAVVAGVTAFLSVKFLMRYFEFGRLDPFGYYSLAFGAASLLLIVLK